MIGATRYERTADLLTERNGHRPKALATKAGNLEVRIPKLRRGSYFPSFLEPRRRIDQAFYAVVMEACVKGVSTRSVDDLVAALEVSSGISRSEVSRICAQLDEAVEALRNRPLDHARFPYIYLDATYLHLRCDHHVVSKAVLSATGTEKSWMSTSATQKTSSSGARSCPRSRTGASRASSSSSPTSAQGSWPPSAAASRRQPTSSPRWILK